MNGAESLIKTMIDAGVEVCFSNPGTSEMQLVAAIDKHDGIRPVLALFEGVATGAADGYGRMAGKPAATLLHLGPGLGNGMANLHNAKRARTPLVNIVGDHATYHLPYDAPLTSDVVGYSKPVSDWIRVAESSDSLAGDIAAAIAAASTHPGQIATLIVPANHAWDEASATSEPRAAADIPCVSSEAVDQAVAALLSGDPVAIMLGGMAFREGCLEIAGRIAEATGAILIGETFAARIQRGRGRVAFERLPYFGEMAADALKGFKHIILAGAKAPVSFFAYPGKPSWLAPDGCECPVLAEPEQDIQQALSRVADAVGAKPQVTVVQPAIVPDFPQGKLTAEGVGAVVAALLPENAVVSDEAATAGLAIYPMTAGAAKHDWLMLTGGAIGQGLPLALGAAVACPDRKVVALQADGSAMYTVQSLWTMARENLDVTTIIINNGSYAILNIELARVGVESPGPKALSMLDLTNPAIDWVQISEGMGVPATHANTVGAFREQLAAAFRENGPRLVEAVIC